MFDPAGMCLQDTRVPYWAPAKWVAKLRYCLQGSAGKPLLLRVYSQGGHGRPEDEQLSELATEFAFMIRMIPGRDGGS